MLQMNEIQQRFNHVEQVIHDAAQAVQSSTRMPMDVKDCIQKLEEQTDKAKQTLQQAKDENQVIQVIDQLEDIGDEARDVIERNGNAVEDTVKSIVMQAHRELSDLKHQLH
jgi:ElaB/YqjD/DUF883 family membrane-anchored ribosome-binding protein